MTLPRSVSVFGHTFAVILEDDPLTAESDGYCDHEKQAIHISPGLCDEARRETLFHEMLEAANELLKMGLTHEQITVLANFVFQSFVERDES